MANMQWGVTVQSTYDGNVGVTQLINGTILAAIRVEHLIWMAAARSTTRRPATGAEPLAPPIRRPTLARLEGARSSTASPAVEPDGRL